MINHDKLEVNIIVGELSLRRLHRTRSKAVCSIALHAREMGYKGVILPMANADEAAVVEGVDIIPVENLKVIINFLNDIFGIPPHKLI